MKHWKKSILLGAAFYIFMEFIAKILSLISYFDLFLDASGSPVDLVAFWIMLIIQVFALLVFMAFASFWLFKKIEPSLRSGFQVGAMAWGMFYVLTELGFFLRIAFSLQGSFHLVYLYVLIPPPIPLLVMILVPVGMGWVLGKRLKK